MKLTDLLYLADKYLKNDISEDEMALLDDMLKHEEYANIFKDIVKEDYVLKSTNREFNTEKALEKTLTTIEELEDEEDDLEERSNKKFAYNYAAVITLLFALTIGLKFLIDSRRATPPNTPQIEIVFDNGTQKIIDNSLNDKLLGADKQVIATVSKKGLNYTNEAVVCAGNNTLKVPFGKQFHLVLSDSTEVYLNAGTTLTYPVCFNDKPTREVILDGEAFFKVHKDKTQPFIVTMADDIAVEVLGTEFNVNSYKNTSATYTTLKEGSVKVKSSKGELLLKPGEQTIWNKDQKTLEKKPVDIYRYTAWMTKTIVFTSTSFNDILTVLKRHYNVEIINNNTDIANEQFTARFENESIERVMNYFSKSYGFTYKINGNKIIID